MKLDVTEVWQWNWDAIHKICDTCSGLGHVNHISCSWCGDGIGNTKESFGSGKYYRYIINRGSSRSSKTYSLIDCFDIYARQNENKRLTVWRDTKIDCKKTVLQDTLKILKRTNRYKVGQDFNKTESIFSYDTGSTFEIHGTDDEETVHGLTQDAAWLNEPYKISRDTFDQIDQRTSDFIFIDYNPKKGHWVEQIMLNKRSIVIHSTFKNNRFCPAESRKKILSYQPVKFAQAVIDKKLTEGDAKFYDFDSNPLGLSKRDINELIRCIDNEANKSANAFNWEVYGLGQKAERPNRIFRWESISDLEYLAIPKKKYIGNDWGKVDPWGIIEAKYTDGNLYVKELNYQSEDELRQFMLPQDLATIQKKEEGIVSWMFKRLKIDEETPVVCDTNRPGKIAALRRSGFQAFGANKPKGSLLDGIDILENLNVFYTESSKNIEHEQENYCRVVEKDGSISEEPEDIDNHLIDAIRYVALYLKSLGIIRKV
jgi:PBSX family phage terminase large subunit